MDSIKTGQFIQELRKAKKLTQNDLADLLQVTNKAVSRWETGEGFPDVVLLPRLSEVLSVTIDDILNGERIEKKKLYNQQEKMKLQNIWKISITIIGLSFVLFLGLTYSTFKVWIGFMAYVIPSTLALVWILIARSNYMNVCEYNDDDRIILFKTLRTSVILYAVLLAMMLPQPIIIAAIGDFANSVIPFNYYILYALLTGGIAFFGTSWYFYIIDVNDKNKKVPINKKITVYLSLILVAILGHYLLRSIDQIISFEPIISTIFVSFLVYLSLSIYYLTKKYDWIKVFGLRIMILLILIFIILVNVLFDGDIILLQATTIILYCSIFLLSIIGFIWKFSHYKNDSLLRLYFENIFLLTYFFLYILGLGVSISIIIIFGILDIFINKKMDSKSTFASSVNGA